MRCFSAFFGLPASSEFLTEGVTDRSCGYNAIVAAFDACSRNKSVVERHYALVLSDGGRRRKTGGIREIMKKVAIIMGSDSDLPVVRKALDTLTGYGVPAEMHIMSAHRTPAETARFAAEARRNGFGVILAAAGKAAHLAGALAAGTTLPVIGIPMKSSDLGGMDALLSTVQMPSGIPVATVAIDGAVNAALLAVQILAVEDASLAEKLDAARADMAAAVRKKEAALQNELSNA